MSRTKNTTRPDLRAATVERMERGTYPWRMFDPFPLGVPALRVDTTCGYVPGLEAIIAFCRDGRAGHGVEDEARTDAIPLQPRFRGRERSRAPRRAPR